MVQRRAGQIPQVTGPPVPAGTSGMAGDRDFCNTLPWALAYCCCWLALELTVLPALLPEAVYGEACPVPVPGVAVAWAAGGACKTTLGLSSCVMELCRRPTSQHQPVVLHVAAES